METLALIEKLIMSGVGMEGLILLLLFFMMYQIKQLTKRFDDHEEKCEKRTEKFWQAINSNTDRISKLEGASQASKK